MPFTTQDVRNEIFFKNVHGNYREPFAWLIRLFNDPSKTGFNTYNQTSKDAGKVIQFALDRNIPLRACGRLWSLSKAPYVRGAHIFSYNEEDEADMKFKTFLDDRFLQSPGQKPNTYLFAQCGNFIKDLSAFCESKNRSLKTSGASNGQTIAGAIGTGVHGSALHVGSIQDTVVGLHIIKGPGPEDSVYLEPASQPVAKSDFARQINATLVRDDDLFAAALVSVGGFGFIHGVVVETAPVFILANFIRQVDISDAYQFIRTMSVAGTPMDIAGMDAGQLYHMKFYINQYRQKDNVRAEIIYDLTRQEVPGLEEMMQPGFLKYNKDFLLDLAKLITAISDELIPKRIDKSLPKDGDEEVGRLSQIFGDTTNLRDGQFACAVAVDTRHAEALARLMMKPFESKRQRKIPSVFSFRFVPKSKATLAFTRYDMNCLIGIDGIETKSTKRYLRRISKRMIQSGIPHTWHWGKANFMDREFVKTMYGDDWKAWHAAKARFLRPEIAQLFSSKYLRERGL